MRGKVPQFYFSQIVYRITPAYAGKSAVSLCCGCLWWDHPRLCGEKLTKDQSLRKVLGSPPPMRGKVCGISFTLLFCEDHPRLCGEKAVPGGAGAAFYGSPPPMRGKVKWLSIVKSCASRDHPRLCGEKLLGVISSQSQIGITPAYAGKRAEEKIETCS